MIETLRAMSTRVTKRTFRFLSFETRGMHQAAYLLAAFALLSQLLGLLRDRLLASSFGAGHTLDLYYAAFRVPDLLFATVASLFSLYALMPILSRLEREQEGLMVSFLYDVLGVFFAGMAVVGVAAFFLAPLIVVLISPGLSADPASRTELILLVRVLLLQPILLGASNTIAALTQLRHRFVLYSVSPLLYNLGIIFGALVLYPLWGTAGLGWGVVLGAFAHMAVQLPFFFSEPSAGRLAAARAYRGVREVLMLSIPRTLALASSQISLLIIYGIASLLSSGSIAIFTFAYNLQAVPLTIIGVSYSVAAFPTLARLHANGASEEFSRYIETALRHILFWTIPATVFFIVLRAQIVRVILGAGQFDWNATRLTAAALALFILSLAAQSITLLIMRAYYAAGETKKPLYRGIVDIVVSVLSALGLLALFHSSEFTRDFIESLLRVSEIPGTDVLMLPLGYTLGALAQCVLGLVIFARDFHVPYRNMVRLVFESFASSVIGAAASYGVLALFGAAGDVSRTATLLTASVVAGLGGLLVTAGMLFILKNREFLEAISALKRRFSDVPQVALEPTDVSS